MASPSLYIDALYSNPAARVFIQHPANDPVRLTSALTESDFPLTMSAVYSDSDEAATQLGVINKVQQGLANFTGGSQRVLKVVQQTFSQYNGTNKPQFTLPITLVKYRKDYDIIDQIANFYAAVAPTFSGVTLKAPYGYGLTGDSLLDVDGSTLSNFNVGRATTQFKDALGNALARLSYQEFRASITGTWAIQYSTWFRASKLVLTEVNGVISKETAKGSNSPLYAKLNLTFMPAILPSQQEVQSWFIKGYDADPGAYQDTDLAALATASNDSTAR